MRRLTSPTVRAWRWRCRNRSRRACRRPCRYTGVMVDIRHTCVSRRSHSPAADCTAPGCQMWVLISDGRTRPCPRTRRGWVSPDR